MPIDETNISDFTVTRDPASGTVHLRWSSTSAAGQWFQVYRDGRLAWVGQQRYSDLPLPAVRSRYTVVEVDAATAHIDQSGDLSAPPGAGFRANLAWKGGRYLVPTTHDLVGFRVYGEATPGGGIDYVNAVAFIPAALGPEPVDGFGRGRFGRGGFGYSEVEYAWASEPLTAGTWNFAVKAVDGGGIESTTTTASVAVGGPPGAPEPFPDGRRLHATWDGGTQTISLAWQAPP